MSSASFDPALPAGTAKSQSSIMFGATIDFMMSPGWSFETGALYGTNGIRIEVDANNYIDLKQAAINIPALLRYHFGPRTRNPPPPLQA